MFTVADNNYYCTHSHGVTTHSILQLSLLHTRRNLDLFLVHLLLILQQAVISELVLVLPPRTREPERAGQK